MPLLALAGMVAIFKYLKLSVAAVLALIGGKLLAGDWLMDLIGPSFNLWMLAAVAGVLVIGVIASLLGLRQQQSFGCPHDRTNRKLFVPRRTFT